ncbi:hypothetical protein [Ruminiclostridium cellulolyticum]|uniref:Ribbon-helix-helix protein CopG domain-containing protein n=1 Tax=Ruminiclostridium cellulolyticum (strain ATCC 35319 / DSM 5812 / JCM 6584 / H10) TaxID=394503 RepID=B8I0C5_RUMCH|nr:hypothetical protein [Ruminiclostridium cellulolyticum]ACL77451.1 hypothetical protein Ccel_3160 [Ruminiclostridium cellulolyticum H10]
MVKRKTNPEELKRSIRFKAKSIEDMKKLAAVRSVSVSDIVREFVEKGLAVDGYKNDIDFITEIIHKELKEVLEPQINRIVKMLMKIGKVSAGTMYANLSLIQLISDEDQEAFYEMINRSLRLGVEYMKKKDVEIDQYLGQAEEVGKDSRRVK